MSGQRHVVVSGGGSGIGAAIAAGFAQAGARVTILGRDAGRLAATAGATGALALACDVTDRAALDAALAEAAERQGPVGIAVANAGAAASAPFARLTPEDFGAALAVNLTGVFNLWQASLPGMKAQGWGRLIAIASTAGLKGYPYVSAYCAAKHGVVGLTRALAVELGATGITVNAICPGYVETPLLDRAIATIVDKTGMEAEAAAETLKAANPQRRFVQAEEVAGAALWLASEAARSVSGQALAVSGGEV